MRGTMAFLPDDLRPVQPSVEKRRPRYRELAGLLVLAFAFASIPAWQLREIEITGGEHLPETTLVSLEELVGTPLVTLDFDSIRHAVEVWPKVGSVDVRLDLSGALDITVRPASVRASVPVGLGWHGIAADGSFAGALAGPEAPVLVDFPKRRDELRRGLVVAERVERSSGAEVARVRRIMPSDLEISFVADASIGPVVARVTPEGSHAEDLWCAAYRSAEAPQGHWFDLRRDDRMVIGGRG